MYLLKARNRHDGYWLLEHKWILLQRKNKCFCQPISKVEANVKLPNMLLNANIIFLNLHTNK